MGSTERFLGVLRTLDRAIRYSKEIGHVIFAWVSTGVLIGVVICLFSITAA